MPHIDDLHPRSIDLKEYKNILVIPRSTTKRDTSWADHLTGLELELASRKDVVISIESENVIAIHKNRYGNNGFYRVEPDQMAKLLLMQGAYECVD